jgi:sucrose-6-phosphate hydrolase SacC (GH32 family)
VAEFEPGTADEFGLKVRTGRGEETVIGVAVRAGRLFVDRTRSGEVGFHKEFAARHTAPLSLEGGRVRLRVLVDWSSVEVFANDGSVVLTDQVFPSPASEGVALYAVGGAARLVSLEAWPMSSAW